MRLYKLLTIVISAVLAACSVMNVKHMDDSFTEENLSKGIIIFGGLVSQQEIWSDKEILEYSTVAINSLSSSRENLLFKYYKEVIGDDEKIMFNTILESFRSSIKLERQQLEPSLKTFENYKYIIFARLQGDEIKQSSREEHDEKNKYTTVYVTKRTATIYLEVYDLDSYKVVWSGDIKQEYTNENRNPHGHNSNFLSEVFTSIVEDAIYGTHPEPPHLNKLIDNAFSDIADSLPAKSCSDLGVGGCIMRSIKKSFNWIFGDNTHNKSLQPITKNSVFCSV